MAFDQPTRNRLNNFVGQARALLTDEFVRQLQSDYGIDPSSGRIDDVAGIIHLDDRQRETARILRDTLHHYTAGKGDSESQDHKTRIAAIDRIVREQAFTVLNRLAALRMMEARGLLITSIAEGARSDGFQLYQQLAGVALGETDEAYIAYIFSLFDEFAVDLPVLFDRFSPQGRLFPNVRVLRQLLGLINDGDIGPLWAEDETIGWIYQYFNSKEERQQMRKESSAPRNSRELAVRNQFFTPRYVVEFLTDNTLGRIWYEMTKGQTRLVDECRYLVRRPNELFLGWMPNGIANEHRIGWLKKVEQGDFSELPARAAEEELVHLALTIDGYSEGRRLGYGDLLPWASEQMAVYGRTGQLPDSAIELWLLIFAMQREHRVITGSGPAGDDFLAAWQALYQAWKRALQGDTSDLTQEELLRQPVFIPHRPLKDPREIKMLDPACGSMHFGLYAFDLFETIYDETWEMGVLGDWAVDYRDKAAFMRDVPRLIIEHNIHGIDIDARAVQIAGLSLWLRAQRSWQAQGVLAANRPTVARSNVVVAEPMPGDEAELEAFLTAQFDDTAQDQIVAGLVQRVFEAMKLAGEVGSLLKIEEDIADDIVAAKGKWTAQPQARQGSLFERPQQASMPLETVSESDEQFWEQVENRVYAALKHFAEQAEQGDSYLRRLFAEDATRGFAFIDLFNQVFDVVLMNPPFGDAAGKTLGYLRTRYRLFNDNLYCAFFERGIKIIAQHGRVGAITDRSYLTKQSYESLRVFFIHHDLLDIVVDLGWGVLDANVETCISVIGAPDSMAMFSEIGDLEDRGVELQRLSGSEEDWTLEDLGTFSAMPFSSIAYSTPVWMRNSFRDPNNRVDRSLFRAARGMAGADADRLYRLVFESPQRDIGWNRRWTILQKGSPYSPYYFGPEHLLLAEEQTFATVLTYSAGRITGKEDYGKPGLSYGKRTDLMYAFIMAAQQVFSVEGQAIFAILDSNLWQILAIVNSVPMQLLVNQIAGQHKLHGYVNAAHIPSGRIPDCTKECQQIWDILYRLDSHSETACHFIRPRTVTKSESFTSFRDWCSSIVEKTREDIEYCSMLDQAINQTISSSLGANLSCYERDLTQVDYVSVQQGRSDSPALLTLNTVSYLIGCCTGRWDIRLATGEKEVPPLPDPFDPLPACPPGMLQNTDGSPAAPEDVPDDYPLRVSWPGILVDDDGHVEDIVGRVREALHVIWDEKADNIEVEACSLLGVDGLRDYFANPNKFFADHLSRYSKSRRVAPIYWPLTTTNGSYTLWLYYHRLDAGTLYQCVNDFVDPKLGAVQRQLNGLRNRSRDREDERELERLTDLAVELETFRKDLLDLARFWHPNLNDGVEITAAPLYALFGHRNWRSRLEEAWGKLQDGEYDWALLAMSIWPGRVVPKCVKDRSLAIAHDIEKLFWVREDESWRPLRSPDQEVAHQVEIRQSAERDRLRDLFAELAADEGRYLPAMQVWQSLADGEWDHQPLGLHLYPERAAVAAFDDATRVYPHLDQPDQKLLQKATLKNKQLLTKRLMERGTPELVSAVAATLADEPAAFAELWRTLGSGKRDDLPLALELWPERVVGKALRDPDLAAKHGLFDFFWYDEPGAGVRRREPIDREIAHEVERRGGDRL